MKQCKEPKKEIWKGELQQGNRVFKICEY